MQETVTDRNSILRKIFAPIQESINDLIQMHYFSDFKREYLFPSDYTDLVDEV